MSVTLEKPKTDPPLGTVAVTVEYDNEYVPWGEPEIIEEENRRINAHDWPAYCVTVRATGPVEREESLTGCVVPLTDTGIFQDAAAIPDAHL